MAGMGLDNLLCYLLLLTPIASQINLALNRTTAQSSDFYAQTNSSLAVDGCRSQTFYCDRICNNRYRKFCCPLQQYGQLDVWWTVDLGQHSEISSIYVLFRKYLDDHNIPYELFKTQGYSIRISNNSDPYSGTICYTDTAFDLQKTTRSRNHTSCTYVTGRYVHFTNKASSRNYNDPLLELCDVQVWGCEKGKYGQNCDTYCSTNCLNNRCNPATGHCSECTAGYYGEACIEMCGNCKYTSCDRTTGNCLNNECENGFTGDKCTECIAGYFGITCIEKCGSCKYTKCDRTTGNCLNNECENGFTGDKCTECIPGFFGTTCSDKCGRCKNTSCNKITGNCLNNECENGFTGGQCTDCQPKYFGVMCNQSCGACQNRFCNRTTGHCLSNSCDEGYSGITCKVKIQTTESSEPSNVGMFVGGAVALVVISIAVITVVIWYKRRMNSKRRDNSSNYYVQCNHFTSCNM